VKQKARSNAGFLFWDDSRAQALAGPPTEAAKERRLLAEKLNRPCSSQLSAISHLGNADG